MRRLHLDVYAWRSALSIEDDADPIIHGDASKPFAVTEHGLWFATAREAVVPLLVEFHDAEPPLPDAAWDLVVDVTLSSPSGRLSMVFPHDELQAVVLAVGPGLHHVRVSGAYVDDADPLDDEGPDRYRLQIWPATEPQPPRVVRLPAFLGPTGEPRFRRAP